MTNPAQIVFNPDQRAPGDFLLGESFFTRLARSLELIVSPQSFVMGVDISHWNSSVDFVAMKAAGFEFVIIKATEGNYYLDPEFQVRWQQALSAGLIVGPYHFFRSNVDGVAQAEYHLNAVHPLMEATKNKMIPSANDVETADGVSVSLRQTRVLAWNNRVAQEFIRDPLCYSSPYLWSTLCNNMPMDATSWVAHWTSAALPTWMTGLTTEDRKFWQIGVYPTYSWVPAVPGVSGSVDVNKFFGTLADLQEFVGIGPLTESAKVDILWNEYLKTHPV